MAKVRPISGFPEWLPEERMVEQRVIELIRRGFERFGFAPIDTRAVEPLDWLVGEGATDKEIYTVQRLHADEGDEARLGLHFDLTVPFARYVVQNRGRLAFPFKRYQIQKSWRGERPQEGRYREFYQADADVIAEGELALAYDAEMIEVLHEVTSALPLPPVTVQVNNRRVLEGFYRGLGVEEVTPVLRAADKIDKIGAGGVRELLVGEVGLAGEVADRCLAVAEIRGEGEEVARRVRALGVEHELLTRGLEELTSVLQAVAHLPAGAAVADLRIARGLDYYTGTVYEGTMEGYESLGSVCSGGRYDDLASGAAGTRLPGVGISIGVSRILGKMLADGRLSASRATPTCVLVALFAHESRADSDAVARALRRRGIASEVHPAPQKLGKQIRAAERRGIPFVWFPESEESGHAVKNILSGEQTTADPATWEPPDELREVAVIVRAEDPPPDAAES